MASYIITVKGFESVSLKHSGNIRLIVQRPYRAFEDSSPRKEVRRNTFMYSSYVTLLRFPYIYEL